MPMQSAILHHHLQTGGVTRAIEQNCRVLLDAGHRVVVIAGLPPAQALPNRAHFALVPGLAYGERRPPLDGPALAGALIKAAHAAPGGDA